MHAELTRLEREHSWRIDSVLSRDTLRGIWKSSSAATNQTAYLPTQWAELDNLLEDGWWTAVRNRVIERVLHTSQVHSALWDLGGGTGTVSRHLLSKGFSPIGVEPSMYAAELATARGVETLCADLIELNLPTASLHAVSMFDVLEHLDHREQVLHEVHRVLKPGGHLVLTVPALMMLWSQHDVDLGHRLRYSRGTLAQSLAECGFAIERIGYFFFLTVLPLLLLRSIPYRLGRRRVIASSAVLSAKGGTLGNFAGLVERNLALRVPVGSSLVVVARRP